MNMIPLPLLAVFALVAFAEDAPKPAPPKNEPPPEFKAYREARAKTDAVEKIAALEAVSRDFPNGGISKSSIQQDILDVVLKEWPGDKTRIDAQIKTVLAGSKKDNLRSTYRQLANSLLNAGIDYPRAEKFAREALKLNKEATYIADEKATYAKRKATPPSDDDLRKRYRVQLASFQSKLAEILYKEGRTQESEKLFKEAFEADNTLTAPMRSLARLAERRQDEKSAFNYLAMLRLSGSGETADNKRAQELFTKLHPSDNFDSYLDNLYREKFPSPLHEEHYQKTANRTDRAVLAEVFTGSGCPPCVAADLVFDAALERYARQDVVVLMYHQHIPKPDPMTNPTTVARAKFYNVNGVPSYAIDGKLKSGGGPRTYAEEMWGRVNPDIEKRLELAPAGAIRVTAAADAGSVKVKAMPSAIKTEEKELTLQVALVEETLRYTGENGIRFHPMVVRAMGGPEEAGFKIDPAKPAPVEVSFDLAKIASVLAKHLDEYEKDKKITFIEKKSAIDARKLGVVAFVQDPKSKEILQSVFVKLEGPVATN
jgi:hypothetical protein